MSVDEMMRLTAVAEIPVLLVLMIPFWYALTPRGQRRRSIYKGRRLSIGVHLSNLLAVLALLGCYFVVPLFREEDPNFRGMVYLDAGAVLLFVALAIYRDAREGPDAYTRYMVFQMRAAIAGGTGLFMSGVFWLLYKPAPAFAQMLLLGAALLNVLAGEILFLRNNKWKPFPRDPR